METENFPRRVFNIAPHQNRLPDFDLTSSGGIARYDQIFDSQHTHFSAQQSQEHSQRYGQYDSNFSQTHNTLKKAETEIKMMPQVHFSTQDKAYLEHMKTAPGGLERIDENRSMRSSSKMGGTNTFKNPANNTSQSNLKKMVGAHNINANTDLSDIVSQSNRLEESVKAVDRAPIYIPYLTDFLCERHYKKIGVFSKKQGTLFQYWKDCISKVHKLRRLQKLQNKYKEPLQQSIAGSEMFNRSYKEQQNDLGLSFKEPKETIKMKSISEKMHMYENLYEMDVIYTLQKDIEEEELNFKTQKMRSEIEMQNRREENIKRDEQLIMKQNLKEFYEDLATYKISQSEFKNTKQKQDQEQNPNKNWHRQITTNSINPIESIDEDKKEPQKPALSNEELDKENSNIKISIRKEYKFMKHAFFAMRDEQKLTNDPRLILEYYKKCQEKARLGLTLAKGEEEADRIIRKFFKPQSFLKRLTLFKQRYPRFQSLSLYGLYCRLSVKERILNFVDWTPSEKIRQTKNLFSDDLEEDKQNEPGSFFTMKQLIEEYESFLKTQKEFERLTALQENEKKIKKKKETLNFKVFGKQKYLKMQNDLESKKPDEKLAELAKPKDKWKRRKIIQQLIKKFPHEIVLQKMLKEEVKDNRTFKYPEEYDQYDDEEEILRKYWHWEQKGLEVKSSNAGKELKEKFKVLDDQDLYYVNKKIGEQRKQFQDFEEYMIKRVKEYLEMMKTRLQGQKETLRQFISKLYHTVKEKFSQVIQQRFYYPSYGLKEESYKRSYPSNFKKYFFQLVKQFVKNRKGNTKRFKRVPPTFILPSGKKTCTMHEFGCPQGAACPYSTLNKKIILRSVVTKRRQRDPKSFRSRFSRRQDFKNALSQVFMLNSELQNCTFEPETGSMSKNLETTLQVNFNLRNNGYDKEPDPDAYFTKMGKNFETSHPEVYKAGVIKRAKLMYKDGKYEEAMNALQEGFNIESIKRRFDPTYMRRFAADALLKIRAQRQAAEKEEEEKKQVSFLGRKIQKDAPENQKKRPEEDFESKKLIPILREAFDLITIIENRKKDAEKQIRTIKRSQTKMKKLMRSFSTYKKSQTRVDPSRGEEILFKQIMCPLKDKCSKIKKPRWPTSNTKSVTQFGEECPFAHHPMELRFPESIITKLSSSFQTIKNINNRMDSEKNHYIFKPAGRLFDCKGCQKCNLCKYKEMADRESKKFNDKTKKVKLERSIERRETSEVREEKKEMKQIMDALDLDNNYTKKFGLLKKSCVLYFYGRFNDAFDEIAKAVKIIQDQKEIEQNKQRIIEKRWRFKLGIDEGFELPIPIEQIDLSKVDEKFLKKMELQGTVTLAQLKMFIEQVHPNKNEEYSKHAFLNKMIEDYYLQFEAALEDKQNTIKKMKKQVEKLDEEADLMEAVGGGGLSSPEKSPEKGADDYGTIKVKPKKTKMCPTLIEKKFCPLSKIPKCPHAHSEYELERMAPGSKMCEKVARMEKCLLVKERKCPYAHNPIELDLISTETKMKNLNSVIQSQTVKMKNMKPMEAWKPAKSGDIEHSKNQFYLPIIAHLMDMTSKKRRRKDDGDEDDEENEKKKEKRKKSIFERENVFKKPYEAHD